MRRRPALDRYLVEMVHQDIWMEGMRCMLASYGLEGSPSPPT
jgi:hypothetical protein